MSDTIQTSIKNIDSYQEQIKYCSEEVKWSKEKINPSLKQVKCSHDKIMLSLGYLEWGPEKVKSKKFKPNEEHVNSS